MKRFVIGLGLAAVLALSAPAAAALTTVRVTDDSFGPSVKQVTRGTTVKWRNSTGDAHSVTSYRGPSSFAATLNDGQSFQRRFTRSGTYKYRCVFHSALSSDGRCQGMCGTVKVSS